MRWLGVLLGLMGLASCSTGVAPLPVFPAVEQVGRVWISPNVVIADRARIAALMNALAPVGTSGGWRYVYESYPSPSAKITLLDNAGNTLCRVDVGPAWVGSDCGMPAGSTKWPPIAPVSMDQSRFLRDFVGGTWTVTF